MAAKLQFTSLRVTIFTETQARRAFSWLKIAKIERMSEEKAKTFFARFTPA